MACTTLLPAVRADICTDGVHFGPIDALMFTRFGDALTDVSDDTEWDTRLDNSTALPSLPTLAPIRFLYGVGTIPLPERTELTISLGRKKKSKPIHTMTFQVDDTGAANAAALATLQENGGVYAVWFVADGELYGDENGIKATISWDGRLIPDSTTAIQTIQITVTWEGAMPAPIASPIQDILGLAA